MKHRRLAVRFAALAVAAIAFVATFHPTRPLYMRHRDLTVQASDGTRLAATLSTPRWGRAPFRTVVVVHGSGRVGREELRVEGRRLVKNGFAVVSYDKRGVAESGGTFSRLAGRPEAQLKLLARDAATVFAAAEKQPEVDASRLGFFGFSQAGWIIPIASEIVTSRFNIILAGPAISTGLEVYYSVMTGDGNRPPQVTDQAELVRRVKQFTGDAGYDPLPYLQRTRVPTLWLLGESDLSVPTFATVSILGRLRREGNTMHTVITYKGAGHDLRDAISGEDVPIYGDMQDWLGGIGVGR